jgi:hypothetical protein
MLRHLTLMLLLCVVSIVCMQAGQRLRPATGDGECNGPAPDGGMSVLAVGVSCQRPAQEITRAAMIIWRQVLPWLMLVCWEQQCSR